MGKQELENIHEVYDDWREETNVKLIAISIDDARNTSKIKPLVNSKCKVKSNVYRET